MNNEETAEYCYSKRDNKAEELAWIQEDDGWDRFLDMLVWLIEFNRCEHGNWTDEQSKDKLKRILDEIDKILNEDE